MTTSLGREPGLAKAVARRRSAAVRSLAGQGFEYALVRLAPAGPVLISSGEAGIRDVGLALHGSYGWPVLRGSSLKGAAHAHARDVEGRPASRSAEVYGGPRPGAPEIGARVGAVTFLDAIPVPEAAPTVAEDVMTPHVQEYYTDPVANPPAEYWNPVPVPSWS